MQIDVISQNGTKTGRTLSLPSTLLPEPSEHVLYLEVKRHLAALHQGTHKAKARADISGSTREIKKQKGTGTARAGSIKSPLFRGGGRVFGPIPRSYNLRLSKKTRHMARSMAVTLKCQDKALYVIEDVSYDKPKTKRYLSVLQALDIADKKTLLLIDNTPQTLPLRLSARNLPKASVHEARLAHAYMLMSHQVLLIAESAFKSFCDMLKTFSSSKRQSIESPIQ